MLIVISPAKTLDYESEVSVSKATQPAFLDESEILIDTLSDYSPTRLGNLMGISHKLAELNTDRNLAWHRPFNKKNARQALLAFKGDVYQGLAAGTFSDDDFNYAQQHLRILSGLYGLLRPLDLMQPYRLEMGTKLKNPEGKNLYAFWGDQISLALNKQLKAIKSDTVLNLASNEYFSAVDQTTLKGAIVSPVFKDWKNGDFKLISFYAKKARGTMSAWVIKNQIEDATGLAAFKEDGYRFNKALSTPEQPVFLRKQ